MDAGQRLVGSRNRRKKEKRSLRKRSDREERGDSFSIRCAMTPCLFFSCSSFSRSSFFAPSSSQALTLLGISAAPLSSCPKAQGHRLEETPPGGLSLLSTDKSGYKVNNPLCDPAGLSFSLPHSCLAKLYPKAKLGLHVVTQSYRQTRCQHFFHFSVSCFTTVVLIHCPPAVTMAANNRKPSDRSVCLSCCPSVYLSVCQPSDMCYIPPSTKINAFS